MEAYRTFAVAVAADPTTKNQIGRTFVAKNPAVTLQMTPLQREFRRAGEDGNVNTYTNGPGRERNCECCQ
jgi:hypothetical protein